MRTEEDDEGGRREAEKGRALKNGAEEWPTTEGRRASPSRRNKRQRWQKRNVRVRDYCSFGAAAVREPTTLQVVEWLQNSSCLR